jgi:hypothetical protein
MQIVTDFFKSNPTAKEVHVALGRLFTDKAKATGYLAGVQGHIVKSYTRDGLVFEKNSDKLYADILEKQNEVGEKQLAYERAAGVDKQQAFNAWTAAQTELKKLEHERNKALRDEEKELKITNAKASSAKTPAAPKAEKEKVVANKAAAVEKAKTPAAKTKAEKALADEVKKLEELKVQLPAPVVTISEEVQGNDNDNNNHPE